MNREEYYAAIDLYKQNHIEHHGILGQKWGIRRFQNPDGSYTAAGRERYSKNSDSNNKKSISFDDAKKMNSKDFEKAVKSSVNESEFKELKNSIKKLNETPYDNRDEYRKNQEKYIEVINKIATRLAGKNANKTMSGDKYDFTYKELLSMYLERI